MDAERLAETFHECYERLAPTFSYTTREASAVPWREVPESNKRLMVAVAGEILKQLQRETQTFVHEKTGLSLVVETPLHPYGDERTTFYVPERANECYTYEQLQEAVSDLLILLQVARRLFPKENSPA